MPALFPIIAIIAVFIFISAHASTHPPRRKRYDDYRSSGSSRGGSRESYDRDRGSSRSGYDRGSSKNYDSRR